MSPAKPNKPRRQHNSERRHAEKDHARDRSKENRPEVSPGAVAGDANAPSLAKPKAPRSAVKNYKGVENGDEDIFDMNGGDFDAYQHEGESSSSSVQNDEIYQIYEELVGVVQDHYEGLEDDDLSKTTAADAEAAGKGGARPKWNKNGKDKKSPQNAQLADSGSDSSDEIGRNPNASPIAVHGKKGAAAGKAKEEPKRNPMVEPRRDDARFQPTMSAVVEETEPESSFKETDKCWKKAKNAGLNRAPSTEVPHPVPEEESQSDHHSLPPDRDDDFSDDDEPADKANKNELQSFTFIPGQNAGDNKGHTFLAKS